MTPEVNLITFPKQIAREIMYLLLFVGETICKGMCHSVVIKNQGGVVSKFQRFCCFFNLYFGK